MEGRGREARQGTVFGQNRTEGLKHGPQTWSTFEAALDAYDNGEYAGLGFVFSSGDPYTGIDLDGCVDEYGQIAPWALEIIQHFDSYTELSVTGTGLHVIVKGDVPNRRNGDVEVYSSKRFFTMTGHVVEVDGD